MGTVTTLDLEAKTNDRLTSVKLCWWSRTNRLSRTVSLICDYLSLPMERVKTNGEGV